MAAPATAAKERRLSEVVGATWDDMGVLCALVAVEMDESTLAILGGITLLVGFFLAAWTSWRRRQRMERGRFGDGA